MGCASAKKPPTTPGMFDSQSFQDFIQAAAGLGVRVSQQEPLARHTTFRIGGPADLYTIAPTAAQLTGLAALAAERQIPLTILGGGSNILVSDAGVRGLVIAVQARSHGLRADLTGPDGVKRPYLVADAGVLLAGLARWAIKNGWAGLEWAVSVPGTLGGAVIGNAGAHGGDMAGSVAWVAAWQPGQGRQLLAADELAYSYRNSRLKEALVTGEAQAGGLVQRPSTGAGAPPVVLTVGLHAIPGDPDEMAARAEQYLARRRASQPTEPSAGSIFRNPPGDYAGRLVEAAGLKGQHCGGAQISPRHANFIINTGAASAADVVTLMSLMRQRVYEQTGIRLLPEIVFLGDWPPQPLSIS